MSEKRYVVRLTDEERSTLTVLVKTEKRVAVRKRTHAQILLKIDQGEHGPSWPDEQAATAFDVHENTVRSIRFITGGQDDGMTARGSKGAKAKIT